MTIRPPLTSPSGSARQALTPSMSMKLPITVPLFGRRASGAGGFVHGVIKQLHEVGAGALLDLLRGPPPLQQVEQAGMLGDGIVVAARRPRRRGAADHVEAVPLGDDQPREVGVAGAQVED